ncbi:unnamed protein product, partial [Heterosigma akashiwo]
GASRGRSLRSCTVWKQGCPEPPRPARRRLQVLCTGKGRGKRTCPAGADRQAGYLSPLGGEGGILLSR